jgi:hypothetical protein
MQDGCFSDGALMIGEQKAEQAPGIFCIGRGTAPFMFRDYFPVIRTNASLDCQRAKGPDPEERGVVVSSSQDPSSPILDLQHSFFECYAALFAFPGDIAAK